MASRGLWVPLSPLNVARPDRLAGMGGARSLLFSVLACVFLLNSCSRPDLSVITEHHQADSNGNYQHSRAAIRWAWRGDSEH